jgi:hypothetical protein
VVVAPAAAVAVVVDVARAAAVAVGAVDEDSGRNAVIRKAGAAT